MILATFLHVCCIKVTHFFLPNLKSAAVKYERCDQPSRESLGQLISTGRQARSHGITLVNHYALICLVTLAYKSHLREFWRFQKIFLEIPRAF